MSDTLWKLMIHHGRRIWCNDCLPDWTTAEAGYSAVTLRTGRVRWQDTVQWLSADWTTSVAGYGAVIICGLDDCRGDIRCSDYLRTGRLQRQDTVQWLCALDYCGGRLRSSDSCGLDYSGGRLWCSDSCGLDDFGDRIWCSDYLRTGRLQRQDTVKWLLRTERLRWQDTVQWLSAGWTTTEAEYGAAIICGLDGCGGRIRCSDYLRTGRLRRQDTVQGFSADWTCGEVGYGAVIADWTAEAGYSAVDCLPAVQWLIADLSTVGAGYSAMTVCPLNSWDSIPGMREDFSLSRLSTPTGPIGTRKKAAVAWGRSRTCV
jgi:hypothetical protein